MQDKQTALDEVLQAHRELAASDGTVHNYRPRSVREKLLEEKQMLEEQDRQRFSRLAELRSSITVRR